MDTGTLSIKKIFGQERRLIVPLFQRPYVWKREEQWEPLWEDIRKVAEQPTKNEHSRPHFLGAIVLDQMRNPMGHLETRLLVDGQQRLTTIQLFLEALCDLCQSTGIEKYHKAMLRLTRNDDPLSEDEDETFKVWPTNVDQDHFRRVMNAGSPEDLRKSYGVKKNAALIGHPLADAYLFFYEAIGMWLGPQSDGFSDRLDALYNAVREQIRMVVIDLDKEDDAQVIFETLNARGTPLLPSDLVKNYLFHQARLAEENIDALYKQYWQPFDEPEEFKYWRSEVGRGHARRARIDVFLQHYLVLKKGEDAGVAHLYATFREYAASDAAGGVKDLMASIREYAEIYRRFDGLPAETREAIFFDRLGSMELTTAYPFLLELFARFGEDEEAVRAVLVDIESWLVRRMICQLNTRGYNRFFIELLAALPGKAAGLAKRVQKILLSSDAESTRWPDDREFGNAWQDLPHYRVLVRARVRMLLEALERELHSDKSEKLHFGEKLTIEHLMPQVWQINWPLPNGAGAEAEAVRERMVHNIGNLTLLTNSLNPSVSNGAWSQKLPAVLEHSGLNLNRKLQKETQWDEDRIKTRSLALFDVACRIWPRL